MIWQLTCIVLSNCQAISKCFIYTNSFKPHDILLSQYYDISIIIMCFKDEETKAQKLMCLLKDTQWVKCQYWDVNPEGLAPEFTLLTTKPLSPSLLLYSPGPGVAFGQTGGLCFSSQMASWQLAESLGRKWKPGVAAELCCALHGRWQ